MRRLRTLLEIDDTLDDGAQEGALLGPGSVLGQRLHDGDATTATDEQHRPGISSTWCTTRPGFAEPRGLTDALATSCGPRG